MSKLTQDQITVLKKLGIKGKTEDEVRPELLKRLKKVNIDEVDNDPINDLITILDAFDTVTTPEEPLEQPETVEEVLVAEEDDEEEELPKAKKNKEVKKELKKEVPKKEDKLKKSTKKVIENETDEELEELAAEAKTKKVEKKSKKQDAGIKSKSGFANLNDISQKEIIDKTLISILDKYDFVKTYGTKIVSFRNKSTVSGRCVLTFDDLKIKANGEISLFIGFNAFRLLNKETAEEKLKEFISEEYKDNVTMRSSGLLSVRNITHKDVKRILTKELLEFMCNYVKKLDGKLNENRKKMTEQMGA